MEDLLQYILGYLIVVIEACGALVLCVGVFRAMTSFLRCFVFNRKCAGMTALRIELGKCMVLALEFQVAADIVKTGVSPTWQDILLLAATIGLRTLLNYLLEHELEILEPFTHPDKD